MDKRLLGSQKTVNTDLSIHKSSMCSMLPDYEDSVVLEELLAPLCGTAGCVGGWGERISSYKYHTQIRYISVHCLSSYFNYLYKVIE